jgi:predicted AlkP superfamily phosphohydrolase/phosphomutase
MSRGIAHWSARAAALAGLLAALATCSRDPFAGRDHRAIVLGIDGMDPEFLGRLLAAGKMPNFARLREAGGFLPLATTMPPQSPVAWSSFITGTDPGGHGIFDFLRHDHRTLAVAESTSYRKEPERLLGIPAWGGGVENLRGGKAFWEALGAAGIEATVIRLPANFPPAGEGARALSGMGTPDLRGTNGTFTLFTTAPPANAAEITGGVVERVEVRDGVVRTRLIGPPNDYRGGAPAEAAVTVTIDRVAKAVRIDVGGERRILAPGEWSDWVRVPFRLFPGAAISGIVRFHLLAIEPAFQLYASPVNIDPEDPALPIASPAGLARDLCHDAGLFHTLGIAEDTKALRWGVFSDEEFLAQASSVLAESKRLLELELARFRGRRGLLFFYLSSVDQQSHVLWRTQDPEHPAYRPDFPPAVKGALDAVYEEADRILGRVLDEADARTAVLVISDHGFAPFRRAVHLNNWLAENGYLALYDPARPDGKSLQGGVDWARSRAYAVGFNGLYLNLFGRETSGTVTEARKDAVLDEIAEKLLAWRDPANGRAVVSRVYRPRDIYSGAYAALAPDLVVGYARGYRASWDTPLGEFGPAALEDNTDAWSGDHLMAAEEVPGVLLANRAIRAQNPRLVDVPVAILELFGLAKPVEMTGRSFFQGGD